MLKAVSYLRVSGQGQIDGDGFDRQRDAIGRYARIAKFSVVEEYRDEGVSGTRELEQRPGLAAILDRVHNNGVRIVIVERADRLARDLMVSEVILQKFRDAGARVVTADGHDLTADDDPTRRLIRQVLAAVAEFEKSGLVLKLRAARDRTKARTGRCEGRKPFGEREGEAETLALMRQLHRKPPKQPRRTYEAIAAELNARGVPTRTGKPWQARTVFGILKRESRSATGS